MKVARPDLNGRGEVVTLPPTQPKNKPAEVRYPRP